MSYTMLLLLLNQFFSFLVLSSGIHFTEFAYPNFTASHFKHIDTYGSFLFSRNGTFKAAMFNPHAQQVRFYLCVLHSASNTVIWSANRDSPVPLAGFMSLTTEGMSVAQEDGTSAWSTPPLPSVVSALHLTESGNLVLLDQSNSTLWESFRYPTDTIVIGQQLPVGVTLFGAVSGGDLSRGDYGFLLSGSDAVLQWQGLPYWELSMATMANANSNFAVDYLQINQTGLYLFGQNGSTVVIQVSLPPSEFRTAKVDGSGQFVITSFSGTSRMDDFVMPVDECRIPYICGKVGLCVAADSLENSLNNPVCSCPLGFDTVSINSCVPSDHSQLFAGSCNSTTNGSQVNSLNISYLELGHSVNYFAIDFMKPAHYSVNLSSCQDLCTNDCSCFGIFYDSNSSGSCYMIENELGSVMQTTRSSNQLGFVKAVLRASPDDSGDIKIDPVGFPIVAVVLLPLSGILLVLVIGIALRNKFHLSNIRKLKSNFRFSGVFSIPGLPLRFNYTELESATNNFDTKIGAGGFGTVYKGTLPDNSLVAVKKINNLGVRGRKDFCTEIAVIGSIHHINLVKLKGFCAEGGQLLLVYEYMNGGSLDKTLFRKGQGPVLEWQERVEIALGSARGLAYLHTGCDQKIIHCDIKPENILLQDHFQAKISDFGLSKLLTREQSSHITTMRGTRGYLAPEWLTSSAVSEKTDVYSFGMVLLEIVSGRKNCVSQTNAIHADSSSTIPSVQEINYFPLYALEMHEQGKYLELVDGRLKDRVNREDVERMVRIALCCVQEEPGLRPTMVSIVGMLEGTVPVVVPRLESLNFLRYYGRRFTEAPIIEGEGEFDNIMLFPDANASHVCTRSASDAFSSYILSQQVSGLR